jgi:hypothetical protein
VVVAGIVLNVAKALSVATGASGLAEADTTSTVTRREASVGAVSGVAAEALRVVVAGIVLKVAKALSATTRASGLAADTASAVTIRLELTTIGSDSSASAETAKVIIPRMLVLLARCKYIFFTTLGLTH